MRDFSLALSDPQISILQVFQSGFMNWPLDFLTIRPFDFFLHHLLFFYFFEEALPKIIVFYAVEPRLKIECDYHLAKFVRLVPSDFAG